MLKRKEGSLVCGEEVVGMENGLGGFTFIYRYFLSGFTAAIQYTSDETHEPFSSLGTNLSFTCLSHSAT